MHANVINKFCVAAIMMIFKVCRIMGRKAWSNSSRSLLRAAGNDQVGEQTKLGAFFIKSGCYMTTEKLFHSCRIANNLGRALGVVFGCLLGMFPLLFIGIILA